jgi:hypothetical protein
MSAEPDDALARQARALDAHYPRGITLPDGAPEAMPALAWESILLQLLLTSVLPLLVKGFLALFKRWRARKAVRRAVEDALWEHAGAFEASRVGGAVEAATDTVMDWSRGLTMDDCRELERAARARGYLVPAMPGGE